MKREEIRYVMRREIDVEERREEKFYSCVNGDFSPVMRRNASYRPKTLEGKHCVGSYVTMPRECRLLLCFFLVFFLRFFLSPSFFSLKGRGAFIAQRLLYFSKSIYSRVS